MTTRHIFVDETKQRDYLLVASVHLATDLTALRAQLRQLLLPKQSHLHMKNERDSRKKQIANTIVSAGVQATVYRAGGGYKNEKQRREACLRALIDDHADGAHTMLTLDQDETLIRWDNQRLIEFTRAAGCRDTVRYQHKTGQSELLLAVPDAIAWCWAKGGDWKKLIQPVVNAIHDV